MTAISAAENGRTTSSTPGSPAAEAALRAAATFWFITAVFGQWVFVYYITARYMGPALSGDFAAWHTKGLIKGYVAGDAVGNRFFAAHVVIAALITTSGGLQLIPQIRSHAITFHRWNGRLYLSAAVLMACGGLWLIWIRGTYLNVVGAYGSTLLAILILICAAMTLRHALARRIDLHRRWASRLFLAANAVWFQRLGYMFWILVNRGPVGIGKNMDGPFDIFVGFGCYLLPLAILEIYLRTRDHAGATGKILMASALIGLTIVMAIGIFAAYTMMWAPHIHRI